MRVCEECHERAILIIKALTDQLLDGCDVQTISLVDTVEKMIAGYRRPEGFRSWCEEELRRRDKRKQVYKDTN